MLTDTIKFKIGVILEYIIDRLKLIDRESDIP